MTVRLYRCANEQTGGSFILDLLVPWGLSWHMYSSRHNYYIENFLYYYLTFFKISIFGIYLVLHREYVNKIVEFWWEIHPGHRDLASDWYLGSTECGTLR